MRTYGSVLVLLACLGGLLACKNEEEPSGDASDLPCGAPPGDWRYLLSCDSELGPVHQCIDYYATESVASAVDMTFRSVCQVMKGTVLGEACPALGSIGSCTATASAGPTPSSPAAMLERQYFYGGNTSPEQYRERCEEDRGIYTPPSDSAEAPTRAMGGECDASSGGDDSGVAFSFSTVLNGEVISCTNYVGEVTAEQLQSLLSQGAETRACPKDNALCGCAGEGVLGTTTTIVYYRTSMNDDAECPRDDANCGPYVSP